MCVNITAPAEHGTDAVNQNSINSIWSLYLLWRKDSVLEVLTLVVCWSVFQDCECPLETSIFTETPRTGEEKLQSFPSVSEGFFPVTRGSRVHPPPVLASHLLSHVFPNDPGRSFLVELSIICISEWVFISQQLGCFPLACIAPCK